MKDDFNFFIPATFEKGKDDKTGKDVLKIKGIASTADEDSDEEVLEPSGFDLSRLLRYGYFNYNHNAKTDPSAIIGEPDSAKVVKNQLYVEGHLYPESDLAQKVYSTAEMLEKSKSKRRFGFSIEGRALEKDPLNPKRITKALITGVAITPTPKNSNTLLSIIKGEYEESFVETEVEPDTEGNIIDLRTEEGKRVIIDKNFDLKVEEVTEKSISTQTASSVVRQDLEGDLKELQKSEIDSIEVLLDCLGFDQCRDFLSEKFNIIKKSDVDSLSSLLEKSFKDGLDDTASQIVKRVCNFSQLVVENEIFYIERI